MSVFQGSRYVGSRAFAVTGTDGVTKKFLEFRIPLKMTDVDPNWVQHTVQKGDELDSIAYQYGGTTPAKSKLYYLIADINDVLFPLDVPVGTKLAVPVKELTTRST